MVTTKSVAPGLTANAVGEQPAVVALAALFTAHRMLAESMDRELRAVSGLSTAQVEVLVILDAAPEGRLRMADIAATVCVSRSGSTQIVDRLFAAGFVERVTGERDRRIVWVKITQAGREIVTVIRPVFSAEADRHLGALAPDQVLALRDALLTLVGPVGG